MTDCVICLISCKTSICSKCNVHCHAKCWQQYLIKNPQSIRKEGKTWVTKCPHCRREGTGTMCLTRAMTEFHDKKDKYVNQIHRKIELTSKFSPGSKPRGKAATDVFELVLESRKYIFNHHDKFRTTVRSKLLSLYEGGDGCWDKEAKKYWRRLFGGKIDDFC